MTKHSDLWGESTLPMSSAATRKSAAMSTNDPTPFQLQLASQLKSVYIFERRLYESRRDGGKPSRYEPSVRYDGQAGSLESKEIRNVWVEIAKRLHAKQIDVRDFVTRVFGALEGRMAAPPNPDQLLGEQAMRLYREGAEDEEDEVRKSLFIQGNIARTALVLQQSYGHSLLLATELVLLDTNLALSALFRYCLGWSYQKRAIRQLVERHYKEAAAIQYMHSRAAYDKHWDKYIPVVFRMEAEQIYAGLSS